MISVALWWWYRFLSSNLKWNPNLSLTFPDILVFLVCGPFGGLSYGCSDVPRSDVRLCIFLRTTSLALRVSPDDLLVTSCHSPRLSPRQGTREESWAPPSEAVELLQTLRRILRVQRLPKQFSSQPFEAQPRAIVFFKVSKSRCLMIRRATIYSAWMVKA